MISSVFVCFIVCIYLWFGTNDGIIKRSDQLRKWYDKTFSRDAHVHLSCFTNIVHVMNMTLSVSRIWVLFSNSPHHPNCGEWSVHHMPIHMKLLIRKQMRGIVGMDANRSVSIIVRYPHHAIENLLTFRLYVSVWQLLVHDLLRIDRFCFTSMI